MKARFSVVKLGMTQLFDADGNVLAHPYPRVSRRHR